MFIFILFIDFSLFVCFQLSGSDCDFLSPLSSFACVYSQCASATLRGTLSSGKLTARRVREAVSSSSSSSSMSSSAALWPMAAHRRHFPFHTGGDITCKHTQELCIVISHISHTKNNVFLFSCVTKIGTQNAHSGLLMTELSVAALGIYPPPLPASAGEVKVSQVTGGAPRCVLDAAEVHSVRHMAGLLSLYICALVGLSWARLNNINQNTAPSSPASALTSADFY